MDKSYVYLISNGFHTKIGKANNPALRVIELQESNSFKLTLVGLIPLDTDKKAFAKERALHRAFKKKQVRGEWYALTDDEIKKITAVKPSKLDKRVAEGLSTDVSAYLKELLSYGYSPEEIRKTRKVFNTHCVTCNLELEIPYRALTKYLDNTCVDCAPLLTKPFVNPTARQMRSERDFNRVKKPFIEAHGSTYIYYSIDFAQVKFSCKKHGDRVEPCRTHLLMGCELCAKEQPKDAIVCYQVGHINTYRYMKTNYDLHKYHTWDALRMPKYIAKTEAASMAALFAPPEDYPTIVSVTKTDKPDELLAAFLATGEDSPLGDSYRVIKRTTK